MIRIDQLCVHLPEELKGQANEFSRLFAAELAKASVSQNIDIHSVQLGPISINPRFGVREAVSISVHQLIKKLNERS